MSGRLGGLWRRPEFLKLWAGQSVSALGSRITRDGLPLAAVLALGATPAQMGVLAAVGALPALIAGLAAGVWVDRARRRPILIASDLGRALLLLTIPLAAAVGCLSLAQLAAVAALTGILTVCFDVAYAAYVPGLVGRAHLVEGNSKLAVSESVAEIAGPGLTGVLVQLVTAPVAILFDALSFVVSAGSVALIRQPEPAPDSRVSSSVVADARCGLRAVLADPILRSLAACAAAFSLFGNMIGPLYALYALRDLGLGPASLGVTVAMGGAGDLLGAMCAGRVVRRWGLGRTLLGAVAVMALAMPLTPLAGVVAATAIPFLLASQLVGDLARSVYAVNELSLRQAITPDHLLGRTNAAIQLTTAGLGPFGALLGGLLAGGIGIRPTLALATLGPLLAEVALLRSPVPHLQEVPDSRPEDAAHLASVGSSIFVAGESGS